MWWKDSRMAFRGVGGCSGLGGTTKMQSHKCALHRFVYLWDKHCFAVRMAPSWNHQSVDWIAKRCGVQREYWGDLCHNPWTIGTNAKYTTARLKTGGVDRQKGILFSVVPEANMIQLGRGYRYSSLNFDYSRSRYQVAGCHRRAHRSTLSIFLQKPRKQALSSLSSNEIILRRFESREYIILTETRFYRVSVTFSNTSFRQRRRI